MISYVAITIQVEHVQPVFHRAVALSVLIAKKKANKIFVTHLSRHRRCKLCRYLTEDAV